MDIKILNGSKIPKRALFIKLITDGPRYKYNFLSCLGFRHVPEENYEASTVWIRAKEYDTQIIKDYRFDQVDMRQED